MLLNCLTPLVLQSLGQPGLPPEDTRFLHAPAGIGVKPAVPGPPDTKGWYGTPYANSVVTENFGVTWEDGQATSEQAERAAAALEAAWAELVEAEGWTPPVSSDTFLLWVLLVDDIGATGYTTEYSTPEYPDGYPVIYLNSTTARDEGFWTTLASHEFHHAIQYAYRDYGNGRDTESWYWEASATWASNLVEPDTTTLDYLAASYSRGSDEAYTNTDGSHQYGMYVFNAWLDTGVVGAGAMQNTWEEGVLRTGEPWRDILEGATGLQAGYLFSEFAAAYGNDSYWRTDTWSDPSKVRLSDGRTATGEAGELGAVYYVALSELDVEVVPIGVGELLVTYPSAVEVAAGRWRVPAGATVAVTATEAGGASWTITASAADLPTDTGDTSDTSDTSESEDTAASDKGPPRKAEGPPPDCGCAGSAGSPAAAAPLLVAVALRRRRRADPRAPSALMR